MFLSLGFAREAMDPRWVSPGGSTQSLQGGPGASEAETPRMSSYLLGFAIGDFSVIQMEPGKSPVPMALYAQRGKAGLFSNDMKNRLENNG